MITKLVTLLKHTKSRYIGVTLVVSLIGMIKNFILLKIFDFDKLGIVALSLNFTATIALLQVGVVTGGYRLFAYKKEGVLKRVNSAVLCFFLMLAVVLYSVIYVTRGFFSREISIPLLFFCVSMGIISLYSDWVVCKLLGTRNISILNKTQLVSTIVAFFVTLTVKWIGMPAVLAGLILQPIIIVIIAYHGVPTLIPTLNLDDFKRYIKKIISLGFIPYLTSALTFFNSQVGRWAITFSLGTAILGRTFLVTLFVALVTIIPAAVSNLFFPTIIERYEKNMRKDLNATLKRQLSILIGYYIVVVACTILLANITVKIILPKQVGSVYLIYAILPSLFFRHISGPAIILFNAAKKFNLILAGSLISVFTYMLLLILYFSFFKTDLLGFFLIESISSLIFFIYNSYNYIKFKSNIQV